jgi:acyl carrier protein
MNQHTTTHSKLIAIFTEKLNLETPKPGMDLLATNYIDSLGMVDLILNLEEQFGLRISLETLDLEVFRTLDSISRFVESGQTV